MRIHPRASLARLLVLFGTFGATGASLPFATGCAGTSAATILSGVDAGVVDAGLILQQIQAFVSVYFQTHTDPASVALAAKIVPALNDARAALDVVVRAAAVATDISDANLQAAVADFSTAFSSVVVLAGQIGVQVSSGGMAPKVVKPGAPGASGAALVVGEPLLLRGVKKKAAQ